jgi:hypothetical protein
MLMFSSMTMGLSGALTEMQPETIAAPAIANTPKIADTLAARLRDRPAPCSITCICRLFAAGRRLVNPGTVMAIFRFREAE